MSRALRVTTSAAGDAIDNADDTHAASTRLKPRAIRALCFARDLSTATAEAGERSERTPGAATPRGGLHKGIIFLRTLGAASKARRGNTTRPFHN
jgi:hypothetical protein